MRIRRASSLLPSGWPWRLPSLKEAASIAKFRHGGLQILLLLVGALLLLLLVQGITWSALDRPLKSALLVCEGDLGSRILSLCAAYSLTQASKQDLEVIWQADKWLPATKFGELFHNKEFALSDSLDATWSVGPAWVPWADVAGQAVRTQGWFPRCRTAPVEGAVGGRQLGLDGLTVPPKLNVQKGTPPCLLAGGLDAWQIREGLTRCMQQLRPTAEVTSLLVGLNRSQLAASVGVLLEAGSPLEVVPPSGRSVLERVVPGSAGRQVEAAVEAPGGGREAGPSARRLLQAGESPEAVLSPGMAPMNGTQNADVPEDPPRELGYPSWSPHWRILANVTLRAVVAEVLRNPSAHFFAAGRPLQGIRRIRALLDPRRPFQTLRYPNPWLQGICKGERLESGSGMPIFATPLLPANSSDRLPLVACAQRQLAELIVLSWTRTLLHGLPSGAAEFIMARAEADPTRGFVRQVALRDGPFIPPLTRQKWAEQSYVNEKHGLLYCSIPKVACTTLRLWMRHLQGLPALPKERIYDVHENSINGLKVLGLNFTEAEATRLVTRPGFFKFVFVRNPWARVLSAYLDKGRAGGAQHSPFNWNHAFFGALGVPLPVQQYNRTRHPSFEEFLELTGQMVTRLPHRMDEHIRPQGDLCSLGHVKYELVGHLETMESDSAALMALLNQRSEGVTLPPLPQVGKSAHPTNSSTKLVANYTPRLVAKAGEVYISDMAFPLNNISFAPPEVLQALART